MSEPRRPDQHEAETHRAVEQSPYYLPVHVRMAEVMMKEGRIRQAIDKYNMV